MPGGGSFIRINGLPTIPRPEAAATAGRPTRASFRIVRRTTGCTVDLVYAVERCRVSQRTG